MAGILACQKKKSNAMASSNSCFSFAGENNHLRNVMQVAEEVE